MTRGLPTPGLWRIGHPLSEFFSLRVSECRRIGPQGGPIPPHSGRAHGSDHKVPRAQKPELAQAPRRPESGCDGQRAGRVRQPHRSARTCRGRGRGQACGAIATLIRLGDGEVRTARRERRLASDIPQRHRPPLPSFAECCTMRPEARNSRAITD
jgi:hypothetical protein